MRIIMFSLGVLLLSLSSCRNTRALSYNQLEVSYLKKDSINNTLSLQTAQLGTEYVMFVIDSMYGTPTSTTVTGTVYFNRKTVSGICAYTYKGSQKSEKLEYLGCSSEDGKIEVGIKTMNSSVFILFDAKELNPDIGYVSYEFKGIKEKQ